MPSLATVFDGNLPASANPGVDPGASVVVWTPTKKGQYQVVVSAPDEAGAPFSSTSEFIVDPDAGGIISGGLGNGSFAGEFQEVDDYPNASLRLATSLGNAVRVVVKVALVASPDGTGEAGAIVGLDELKAGLGIALSDTSEDESLAQLEEYAAAWVEERLDRRFHAPAAKTAYIVGNGTRTLYLWGNVEDGDVVVSERTIGTKEWTALETPDDVFELRTSPRVQKLIRVDGSHWLRGVEYRIVWNDGYTTAPADIRALVIDAVNQARNALIAINDEGTVKSETIGDYSYTLDLSVAAGALSAGLTGTSQDTINRWRQVRAG